MCKSRRVRPPLLTDVSAQSPPNGGVCAFCFPLPGGNRTAPYRKDRLTDAEPRYIALFRLQNKLPDQIERINMCGVVDVEEPFEAFAAPAVIQQQKRQRKDHEALEIVFQQRF